MNYAIPKPSRHEKPSDVGTLWSMQRLGHYARCALLDRAGEWELRVLCARKILLRQRCPRGDEAFALAEMWRRRMLQQGWRQVVPHPIRPDVSDRQPTAPIELFPAR